MCIIAIKINLFQKMLNDVNVYTLNEIKISYQNFHNLNKEPSLIKFQDCKMSRHVTMNNNNISHLKKM